MFDSIINNATQSSLDYKSILLCTIISILLGLCIATVYMYRHSYNKNFVVTVALLPAMVQAVIMLVNGNLGTGVAVMGTFSLIKFRSVPGSSREIGSIFFAMAIGLATGMGYIGFAFIFTFIVGGASILLSTVSFGEQSDKIKELKVIIPENLDYTDVFDDLFKEYTKKAKLFKVKTTNMGSLYQLFYQIELVNAHKEKELIDKIRCRNGNLTIVCGRMSTVHEEL